MEFQQLKSFVAVAETGSITQAAELVHLSQPAVSAHIKAMEAGLGISLFDRNGRGMQLTKEGATLKRLADETLSAHRSMLGEATRLRGSVAGRLRLAAAANAQCEALGNLMVTLAKNYPEVEVELVHATSPEVLRGIREGHFDAGFYIEAEEADDALTSIEVGRFGTYLAAPKGMMIQNPINWRMLQNYPWICPKLDSCCGRSVEDLFLKHQFRPTQILYVDRESIIRTLVAGGVGIGLLHADTAREAERAGEIDLLVEVKEIVRLLFVYETDRKEDPILRIATKILRSI